MNPVLLLKKYSVLMLSLSCLILNQACNTSKPASEESKLLFNSIIPKPVSVSLEGKAFALTQETAIYFEGDAEVERVADFLAGKLKPSTGFALEVKPISGQQTKHSILLTTSGADASLGDEGYEINVGETSIKLSASKQAGLFMGVQSFRQLLPAKIEASTMQDGPWEIATGTIRDKPEYAWRGSMLDMARQFLTVADVKRYMDLISLYKMNVMHLHLTDDQGWRIEIKSWPNLALIGGKTQVGGGGGGYYTQEQYKDIVAYGQSLFMTVVPEVDLPGHINSALASYGELNAGTIVPKEGRVPVTQTELGKDKPTDLYSGREVGFSTLSLKKPSTFKFVEDVVRELAAITPGPYIHLGGDEAIVTKKEDYIVFVNRFQEIVEANGKIMIGWEEIGQANVNTKSIAQHWHSKELAAMAASKGAKVILSPSTNVYLDMMYDTTSRIGYHWAAYIEVDSSYKWKPEVKVPGVPKDMIVGVEAPVWGETVKNIKDVEYLSFPRIPGVAEIGWTPTENRNWDEYKIRLGNQAKRFKVLEIGYHRSKVVPWVD